MRVLLATESADLGHALSLFLSERRIEVVDVVDGAAAVLAQAAGSRPDVVVIDWRLGEAVSTQLVADLMHREDPTPVIILSNAQQRARARACGAAAYAMLGDPPDALLDALREVGACRDEERRGLL